MSNYFCNQLIVRYKFSFSFCKFFILWFFLISIFLISSIVSYLQSYYSLILFSNFSIINFFFYSSLYFSNSTSSSLFCFLYIYFYFTKLPKFVSISSLILSLEIVYFKKLSLLIVFYFISLFFLTSSSIILLTSEKLFVYCLKKEFSLERGKFFLLLLSLNIVLFFDFNSENLSL